MDQELKAYPEGFKGDLARMAGDLTSVKTDVAALTTDFVAFKADVLQRFEDRGAELERQRPN